MTKLGILATLVSTVLCNLSRAGKSWGNSRFFRRKWWHRHKLGTGETVFSDNFMYEYEDFVKRALSEPFPGYPRIPCVCPGWDNSSEA